MKELFEINLNQTVAVRRTIGSEEGEGISVHIRWRGAVGECTRREGRKGGCGVEEKIESMGKPENKLNANVFFSRRVTWAQLFCDLKGEMNFSSQLFFHISVFTHVNLLHILQCTWTPTHINIIRNTQFPNSSPLFINTLYIL